MAPVAPSFFAAALRAAGDFAVYIVLAALLFTAGELAGAVSAFEARAARFGAAAAFGAAAFGAADFGAAVLVAAEERRGFGAASVSAFAAAFRGVAVRFGAAARAVVSRSADLLSEAVRFAAARFGLAGASSGAGAAAFRVDARLAAGFGSALLLADFVAARMAMACARRLAGVSSVIALILLCMFASVPFEVVDGRSSSASGSYSPASLHLR